ncbi:MAG TPA: hypothetical protein VMW80_14140 [Candidatus Dormibacteraeota bacterium]|nr:hypothetical protein [Candidatus Dormibacteraeota bacterium]
MAQDPSPDPPGWRCCLPTSDSTTISLSCPLEPGHPWLAGRALDILRQEAVTESDQTRDRYAVGRRRGAPLLLGEPLIWNGVPLVVEAVEPQGGALGELTLRLPPWSEMAEHIPEERLWAVTDRLATEFNSHCGVVSDGRAIGYPDIGEPRLTAPRLQLLHLGVVVPAGWLRFLRRGSTPYHELSQSRLVVVLE